MSSSPLSESQASQIKRIAPFLDPHILLQFLRSNVTGSEKLQEQIQERTLIAKKDSWDKVDEEYRNNKLLAILNNPAEHKRLRAEKGFTLERLSEDKGITIADCKKVFSFAKMQYEMGKYQDAERYLFALKEILTNEQHSQTPFILQIFWGLLSTEILLQRDKETLELTSLRKMKEFIEKLMESQYLTLQESMNQKAWIVHQILLYSFTSTSTKSSCIGLFGSLLADKSAVGQSYLNILQVRCHHLLRYLITSLLLSGNSEALADIVLPVAQQEKSRYSDVYTQFVERLYDSFDFVSALALAKELGKAAQDDLLLKAHAAEIQTQAVMLVFQVKARIYRTVNITDLMQESGIKNVEEAKTRFDESIKRDGFSIDSTPEGLADPKAFKIVGQSKDAKAKVYQKTVELVKRTNTLFAHYQ